MTTRKNLKFSEAESFIIDATFADRAGDPLDITDADVDFAIAQRPNVAAILTATVDNGLINVIDAINGEVQIDIDPAEHQDITPGNWLYEARVVLSDGETSIQAKGRLKIEDSIFIV